MSKKINDRNRKVVRELEKGDMVRFKRSILYSHYGVYDGEGKVYHFTGPKKTIVGSGGATILKEDILEVAGDSKIYQHNTRDDTHIPLSPDQIIEIAERYCREGTNTKYNLRDFNCETVASMLRYGSGKSMQVKRVLPSFLLISHKLSKSFKKMSIPDCHVDGNTDEDAISTMTKEISLTTSASIPSSAGLLKASTDSESLDELSSEDLAIDISEYSFKLSNAASSKNTDFEHSVAAVKNDTGDRYAVEGFSSEADIRSRYYASTGRKIASQIIGDKYHDPKMETADALCVSEFSKTEENSLTTNASIPSSAGRHKASTDSESQDDLSLEDSAFDNSLYSSKLSNATSSKNTDFEYSVAAVKNDTGDIYAVEGFSSEADIQRRYYASAGREIDSQIIGDKYLDHKMDSADSRCASDFSKTAPPRILRDQGLQREGTAGQKTLDPFEEIEDMSAGKRKQSKPPQFWNTIY